MSFDAATDRRLNLPAGIKGDSKPATILRPVADLRPMPNHTSSIDTQLILGASVSVFKEENGWALIKASTDNYVGYLPVEALTKTNATPTHFVSAPRSFRYAVPDMKTPHIDTISMGSRIVVSGFSETRGTQYAITSEGHAVIARHIVPAGKVFSDPVIVAETLIHTPYLWGGASAFGIDCSGLVQLCFAMCRRSVLRDTDMQAATIGTEITKADLKRGDLIYWKGHVALYRGDGTIIHANGHTMSVAIEGLDDAIARIGYLYGQPTAFIRATPQLPTR